MAMNALIAALLVSIPLFCPAGPAVAGCGGPGRWLGLTTGRAEGVAVPALIQRMAANQVVLLGESHDSAEDHRWQLHTLAQLHATRPQLAIGFEMFPRRLQPILDRWSSGAMSEEDFLRQAEWDTVWGFDARDYLPLFHYARMNRLPMLALNVERSLPAAVDDRGWDAVPESQREGVSRPARPPAAYLNELRRIFAQHPEKKGDEAAFARFVDAQTVWDRAMAQAIAAYLRQRPEALVVGIMGSGHVRYGHGVAHQLKDLGVARVGALLTWDHQAPCDDTVGLADAIYLTDPALRPTPRMGIAMQRDAAGVRITEVVKDSVAERAGLKAGDVLVEMAGRPVRLAQDVRGAVQRQAPGTWLPIRIRRGTQEVELVARFPPGS